MKKTLLLNFALVLAFLLGSNLFAQGPHDGDCNINPDSLTTVTVNGVAIVDTVNTHVVSYLLDEDLDGYGDYRLNFGPYWYSPDSSEAVRPQDGDTLTITGGLNELNFGILDVIVVYEINGDFWRNPLVPDWNFMGGQQQWAHRHQFGYGSFAFGMMHDTLNTITVSGTALVDSTMRFARYYLDADADTVPDYLLNFGPPWYLPESGATRPDQGDAITITGALVEHLNYSVLIVFEINGEVWRDSTAFGHHFAGGWIVQNMSDSARIHSPFDRDDWIDMRPGWNSGMGHGHMMDDSLFVQMLELYPWNMPGSNNGYAFANYEFAAFNHQHMNRMQNSMGIGGQMEFANQARIQFHYTEQQMNQFQQGSLAKTAQPLDESAIEVVAWDAETESWTSVQNVSIDTDNNIISFETANLSSNYSLVAPRVTSVENGGQLTIQKYTLDQNYPNPFNADTKIGFTLNESAVISLTIFDVTGRMITTPASGKMTAGYHEVRWNSTNTIGQKVPSGMYFYRLRVDNGESTSSAVKKLVLLQ